MVVQSAVCRHGIGKFSGRKMCARYNCTRKKDNVARMSAICMYADMLSYVIWMFLCRNRILD